jgi:hypothetical protein
MIKENHKCLFCNKPTNLVRDEKNYPLVIPDDIIPRDALELVFAGNYKYSHHKFCDWKCYNLKVLDNAINNLSHSLEYPEEHFLPVNLDKDIPKAKNTLRKLENFKETLIKR